MPKLIDDLGSGQEELGHYVLKPNPVGGRRGKQPPSGNVLIPPSRGNHSGTYPVDGSRGKPPSSGNDEIQYPGGSDCGSYPVAGPMGKNASQVFWDQTQHKDNLTANRKIERSVPPVVRGASN